MGEHPEYVMPTMIAGINSGPAVGIAEDELSIGQNIDYNRNLGAITMRRPIVEAYDVAVAGTIVGLCRHYDAAGTVYLIACVKMDAGDIHFYYKLEPAGAWTEFHSIGGALAITKANPPAMVSEGGYLYVTHSLITTPFFWKASFAATVKKWGIAAPAAAMTTADSGAGGNPDGTYYYVYTYYNSTDGVESNMSPISASVTVATNQIALTVIAESADAQVDYKRIYRKGGTLTAWMYVAQIANGVGTVTYTDNIADSALSVALPDDGVDHTPAPGANVSAVHYNRIFLGDIVSYGGYIQWTQARERGHFFDDNEPLPRTPFSSKAMFVLGDNLFIGTTNTIWMLRGANEATFYIDKTYASEGIVSNYGATLVSAGQAMYVGEGGVYLFNGVSSKVYSIKQNDLFITLCAALGTGKSEISTAFDYSTSNLYVCFPLGASVATRVLVFQLAAPKSPVVDWVTAFIGGDSFVFYDDYLKTTLITSTHHVYYLVPPSTVSTTASIAMDFKTKATWFGAPNKKKTLHKLSFYLAAKNQTITVKLYVDGTLKETITATNAITDPSYGFTELTFQQGADGRLFQVDFSCTATLSGANSNVIIAGPLLFTYSVSEA
ncbi:MAG: hypothetical protein WC449_05470 [Candidatus Paceibacterota bacterium]